MSDVRLPRTNPLTPEWLDVPDDLNALDPVLWPASVQRAATGELGFKGHGVGDLVAHFGSPLYLIDEGEFRSRARAFSSAFARWDVYYAGKAFLCRAVARWVRQEGLGLDVCSGNELAVALSAGFPPARIAMHGNNKSVAELTYAIEQGVGRIVVDSFEEIDRIEAIAAARDVRVTVLVRVTTGVQAHTHEYIATAVEDQKFGFSIHSGQALEALTACHGSPHLRLAGIHSHIGSQIFGTAAFRVAARRALELVAQFRTHTGSALAELNLGGGYGASLTAQDNPSTPADLRDGLTGIVDETCRELGLDPLKLAIEPGRAIVGPAGVALYTVGTIKPVAVETGEYRTYVSVDGGMSDNIRPALYHADYTAVVANRSSDAEPLLARVVGKHCESGDILVRDVYLPGDLRPGDLLAVPGAGAYARSLASNYNHALKPAVVAIGLSEVWPIVRRETLDDLLALDVG